MKTNDAQVTVLVLLIVLFAMEVVRSATVKGTTQLSFAQLGDLITGDTWKRIVLYFIGALLLELLASVAPTFTIWFVVLLIVGVGVSNADVYSTWLNNATQTLSPSGTGKEGKR